MDKILPLPALKDNIIWALLNQGNQCLVVDPGDASPVLEYLQSSYRTLAGILVTHHHWDHVNGIPQLLEHYPNIPVFGSVKSPLKEINHRVSEGDVVTVPGFTLKLTALEIPGHTLDHIAYTDETALFSGDTLFGCGCGRVFEGTHEQMLHSLNKLKNLNDNVQLYCGHEYTLKNILFSLEAEPGNKDLLARFDKVKKQIENHECTLPSSLKEERATNPFLRCESPALLDALEILKKNDGLKDPLAVFKTLRDWKDVY